MNKNDLIKNLMRGVDEVIPADNFIDSLVESQNLIVKLGFDPTAPDLHLGHSVILNKVKILQDLGHKIVFIVGDFTASIGDPSGKSKTRPALTDDEIVSNATTYANQIYTILDKDKTELVFNSSWLGKMTAKDLIRLTSGQSVARMLERDDFAKRFQANAPISIHEFIYPLLQGYDSVVINADIELGGRDQKFNLLMGRELQKRFGKKQQSIFMMPLLEGTDGVKKMSKSLGNTIDLATTAVDMFGKLMSISDELMWRYYDLLSFKSDSYIKELKAQINSGANPRDIKYALALEITARFHGEDSSLAAKEEFTSRFAKGNLPSSIPDVDIEILDDTIPLANVLKQAGLVPSTSQGLRMIQQGAIRIEQEKVIENIALKSTSTPYTIQAGKRKIARISINKKI